MADQGNTSSLREFRKGNWTVHETMVLIAAKKMDEVRRMKRSEDGDHQGRSRPAELRWKWVEDYCWSKGCLRSQNQCNDKWDNLMRDYKKVRDYERRLLADHHQRGGGEDHNDDQAARLSYWKLEKHERKDRNLPTNMLPQIYEALVELVDMKSSVSAGGGGVPRLVIGNVGGSASSTMKSDVHHHHHQPPSQQDPTPPLNDGPLPLALPPPPPPQPLPHCHPSPTLDSDPSDHSNSPAKRRKRGEGSSRSTSTSTYNEVGSAISKSATIIAEALQACEEKEERWHKESLEVQERRLKLEQLKTETDREAISGLVDAINNLATSIFALASDKKNQTPPK